jgi:hypothetical protein
MGFGFFMRIELSRGAHVLPDGEDDGEPERGHGGSSLASAGNGLNGAKRGRNVDPAQMNPAFITLVA